MATTKRTYEIGTGLFILLGFASLGYLATQTTGLANYREGASFKVSARFTNLGQLKLRAPVKLAGVRIGSVAAIELDRERLDALVTLAISQDFDALPDDSAAVIYSSGLLGDQYVALQPGGSEEYLKEGDELLLTQSSIQIEELIGKYLVGDGAKPKAEPEAEAKAEPKAEPKAAPETPPVKAPADVP